MGCLASQAQCCLPLHAGTQTPEWRSTARSCARLPAFLRTHTPNCTPARSRARDAQHRPYRPPRSCPSWRTASSSCSSARSHRQLRLRPPRVRWRSSGVRPLLVLRLRALPGQTTSAWGRVLVQLLVHACLCLLSVLRFLEGARGGSLPAVRVALSRGGKRGVSPPGLGEVSASSGRNGGAVRGRLMGGTHRFAVVALESTHQMYRRASVCAHCAAKRRLCSQ